MVVDNLTFDDKMKVWIHYMVTQVALNTQLYFETNNRDQDIKVGYHPIKSFDDFCKETNTSMSEGLPGHLWRFQDKIFKGTDRYRILALTT